MNNPPAEIRAFSPTGILGSGYPESSLCRAMAWKPHFIGCDAGSTDGGPYFLGSGTSMFSRAAVKRDARIMLLAACQADIPLLIGSAGMAGGEPNLQWTLGILTEIAAEEHVNFSLAVIHAEQDKAYLKSKLSAGKVRPLWPSVPLTEIQIDRATRIVGMMGPEPYIRALQAGARVVLAGRSSDTSIFAAVPLRLGCQPEIAWHAAKILECGAASAAVRKSPDGMFAWLRDDHFVVEPPNPEYWCTPQSVASHSLYENADPFLLYEPSGVLDTTAATYQAASDRAVKVAGARFTPAPQYSIKLEGVEEVGYQAVFVGAVRDPTIIRQLDSWLRSIRTKVRDQVTVAFGLSLDADYTLTTRIYGRDAVMGRLEPMPTPAHEVCIFFEITARLQEVATAIASSVCHIALHAPIPEWHGLITGLALPYSPSVFQRGVVYRFTMNHVVEESDPYAMFPMEMITV
jgi:hypothetical protein